MTALTTIFVNYNHARFIPESLGSLLAQTRPADELIIIDDTSTDDSVAVIRSLISKHPNARLIQNPVNQGCFANLNDGLKIAQGDILHLAAADDVFYPDFYRQAMTLAEANPQAAVFSARSDVIDESGRKTYAPIPWAGHPLRAPGFVSPAQAAKTLMRDDGWFMGNTALFRRDALVEEGGFPVDLLSFADGYICRLLALKHGACFSPEVLAAWRRMASGFAQSVNDNADQTRRYIANAERRMLAAAPIFPKDYVRRWKARQQFDIHRAALARAAAQCESAGPFQRSVATIVEKIRAAVLLFSLRPWDVATNLRHRIESYRGRH